MASFTHCQSLCWPEISINFDLNVTRNLATGFCLTVKCIAVWIIHLICESAFKAAALICNERWGTHICVERYFEEIGFFYFDQIYQKPLLHTLSRWKHSIDKKIRCLVFSFSVLNIGYKYASVNEMGAAALFSKTIKCCAA